MFTPSPAQAIHIGRSLIPAIREAFEPDETDFVSPSNSPGPSSPSSPPTPLSDADSMDVPYNFLRPASPSLEGHPVIPMRSESLPADVCNLPPASDTESDGDFSDLLSDSDAVSTPDSTKDYASDSQHRVSRNGSDPVSGTDSASGPPPPNCKRKRNESDKRGNKRRRQARRQAKAEEREPTTLRAPTFRETPAVLRTELNSEADMPACSTGFTALRVSSLKAGKVWTLPQALEEGHKLLEWDGE